MISPPRKSPEQLEKQKLLESIEKNYVRAKYESIAFYHWHQLFSVSQQRKKNALHKLKAVCLGMVKDKYWTEMQGLLV